MLYIEGSGVSDLWIVWSAVGRGWLTWVLLLIWRRLLRSLIALRCVLSLQQFQFSCLDCCDFVFPLSCRCRSRAPPLVRNRGEDCIASLASSTCGVVFGRVCVCVCVFFFAPLRCSVKRQNGGWAAECAWAWSEAEEFGN
jgi:hypothetical protein